MIRVRITEEPYPIVGLPDKIARELIEQGKAVLVSENATLEPPEAR